MLKKANYHPPTMPSSSKLRHSRLCVKHADEAFKQAALLFAHGLQVRADNEKCLCPRIGAKAARDLLPHFAHAQRLLGQVVGKRHSPIRGKAPDIGAQGAQPGQQVALLALFGASLHSGIAFAWLLAWVEVLAAFE